MNYIEREAQSFFHTYKRIPLEIDRGEGVYLFTKDGKRYLDMFGGLAVNALGYNHPGVVQAIIEQSHKYIHLSNYYLQEPQLQLAEQLLKYSGFTRLFFSNSGTESIEGAIKLTRKWGLKRNKSEIVSFSNAFHGRTMGALSMMDRSKYRDGFQPFLQNFCVTEFNNVTQIRKAINPKTTAVFLECIQGEGGIVSLSTEFAYELMELKRRFNFLIVADEIQSGIGRTGLFLGFQHFTIEPDVVVLAKPIGGGLPLGAFLGNEKVADVLEPGVHGTTFGGNPVACAAGIVVLDELMERGVINNVLRMGNLLKEKLLALQREFPHMIKEVRGFGLMLGVEMTRECEPLVTALRERGILLNCTNQTVLRFLPPLIIQEDHIEETISSLREVLRKSDQ